MNGRLSTYVAGTLLVLAHAAPIAAQQTNVLSLERAIEVGLQRTPDAMRAEAAVLRSTVERYRGVNRLLPNVQLSTGLNQVETLQRTATDPVTGGIIVLPDTLVESRQRFGNQALLSASWTVFEGGRGIADASAARWRGTAAEQSAEGIRNRVAAEITLAYLDALEASALVEVRRAEVERARELTRTAEGRFDVGEVSEIDVLQARLQENDAEISLLEAEERAETAALTLLERTGLPADRRWALVAPAALDVDLDPGRIRDLALRESPLVREAEARHAAARQDARARRLDLVPTLSLNAQWARSEVGITREAFSAAPRNTQAYYQIGLSWSPLNALGARQEARAAQLNAQADLTASSRGLELALESGLDRLVRARALRERSRLNLALAERQRAQAEERYRLGIAPMVERLTAGTLWAEAALQEITARYAPLRVIAEIERDTGAPLRSLVSS
jgi:outer membrane protein